MKKPVILLCIMIFALCAGCGLSGDASESATQSSSDTAVNEEAATEDTASEAESTSKYNAFIDEYDSFEVTSTSMNNGAWNDAISNTEVGSNKSPQLEWDAVDGAALYVIIMDDTDAWDIIHWKSDNVTETSLDEGWADESEYMGPFPPAGSTHTYEVYVVALKAKVERVKGAFGGQNVRFEENFRALDTDAEGNSGNIIAVGRLSGTYTNQEENQHGYR